MIMTRRIVILVILATVLTTQGCMSSDFLLATISDISEAQELVRKSEYDEAIVSLEKTKQRIYGQLQNGGSADMINRAAQILEEYIRLKYHISTEKKSDSRS